MFRQATLVGCAALGLSLSAPKQAESASIVVDSANIVELVTFSFSDFEGGFSINGSTPTSAASFTFGESTALNFTGQWIDLGQVTAQSRTVYWTDAFYPGSYVASLSYSTTPSGGSGLATITGSFIADDDGGLGSLPAGVSPADIIPTFMDLSHNPFVVTAPFLVAQFLEEAPKADPAAPVIPLPATGLLLLTAIGGIAFAGRRQTKP